GNVNTEVPFLNVTLPGSDIDWKFTTVPQKGLNGHSAPCALRLDRRRMWYLLAWNRGSNDLRNRWAIIMGDEGWAWKNVGKYYKQ
ncbi:hypothetical protein BDQ17DRAFT_1208157, partial [Cyathus striatus]